MGIMASIWRRKCHRRPWRRFSPAKLVERIPLPFDANGLTRDAVCEVLRDAVEKMVARSAQLQDRLPLVLAGSGWSVWSAHQLCPPRLVFE